MKNLWFLVLLAFFCNKAISQVPLEKNSCGRSVNEAKKNELIQYLRKRYKLPNTTAIDLKADRAIEGNCYRELTFEGKTSSKTWQLTMYLSPDQRFLTAEIFDITLDPVLEERRKSKALMSDLVQNKGTSKGPDHAAVTIVEFSDFECPYCRKFADIMDQVLSLEKDGIRVVFHHMPLSMHPWAKVAAESAACAQLQGNDRFWAMHDQLFRHQQEITQENVKERITSFAQGIAGLDIAGFQTCLDNELSLGLVFRDMNLATSNNVDATPTLFINGHRTPGVKDVTQLRQLIAQARSEAQPNKTEGTKVVESISEKFPGINGSVVTPSAH